MTKDKWGRTMYNGNQVLFKPSKQYADNWYITKNVIGEFVLFGCIMDKVRPSFKFMRSAKKVAELLDKG